MMPRHSSPPLAWPRRSLCLASLDLEEQAAGDDDDDLDGDEAFEDNEYEDVRMIKIDLFF